MNSLWLLILPTAIILVAHYIWPSKITIAEALVVGLACAVLIVGAYFGVIYANRADTEIRNGEVLSKHKVSVPCEHCRQVCTGSGKHRSCITVCDHFTDYDWLVKTTAGDFTVARVDRQGSREPPRFSAVQIKEPVSLEHSYQNYVLAAQQSLFARSQVDEHWQARIPRYPRVYDYHRLNRVITHGVTFPGQEALNTRLNAELRALGPRKQINLIVVVTPYPQEFSIALENAWVGGKKNDVVVTYGVDNQLNIQYIRAFTFARSSGNEHLVVNLRDNLGALKDLRDPEAHARVLLDTVTQHYVRKPMSDFEYLAAESEPSVFAIAMISLMGLVAVIIGLIIAYMRDDHGHMSVHRRHW